MSNSLDPDQARLFVGPDLSPNCLQKLSADDTSKQRVNLFGHQNILHNSDWARQAWRYIGIQTVWHSDGVPEMNFLKKKCLEKFSKRNFLYKNYPVCKELMLFKSKVWC